MPRGPRFAFQNAFYHVFNRGLNKQNIFLADEDYEFFLSKLYDLRQKYDHSIYAMCLMPNHFHLLVKQNTELPISKLISKICTSYSMYFNKEYHRVGGLFQSKFRAVLVRSQTQLLWLSAYIHQNPTLARLVAKPEEWIYSSYRDYIGLKEEILCKKDVIMQEFKTPFEYKKFVEMSFKKIKEHKDIKRLLLDEHV